MPSGAVSASLTGAAAMTVAKFAAAAFSGRSGMFAEGVRSAVNCGNSALLALGQRRSRKPPDRLHPFGYGMELYFWTLIVATVLFAVAGVGTVAKGVMRVLDPQELENVGWSYAVLGVSAVLAGRSWRAAVKEFQAGRGDRTLSQAVKKAKDPTALLTLFDGSASLVGLAVAFLGLLLTQLLDRPVLDGVASVLIGLLMAAVALVMVAQCKQLLVGESATREMKGAVRGRLEADEAVERVEDLLTRHLGPRDVLVTAVVRFRDGVSAGQAGGAVERVVEAVRGEHPEVTRVFIQPAAG
jgi:cation diffusion facilitator family transporter